MYYRLVLLLLCSTCLYADWEGDEDEEEGFYVQTPCRIEYGGMEIFCHWGCGHRLYDPRIEEVWATVRYARGAFG